MLPLLTAHLWQSTIFAFAAGLLTFAFRKNRAQVRYWLWLSASLKFLLPFALLMSVGSHLSWSPAAQRIVSPAVSFAGEYVVQPFPDTLPFVSAASRETDWIPSVLLVLWACGFLTIALIRFRGWLRVRDAVRAGTATDIHATVEVRVSPGLLEPGVVGLLCPILLLPDGITERLTPAELKAVIAHELCHVRRRDNLFAAIHMVVETVFWFHPFVWWIGARLVEERERACDEEVLSQGNAADVYADAILSVCKLYVESPLTCVAGVSGASIRRRIEEIMSNRRIQGLNRGKKFLLAAAGFAALAFPVTIGLLVGVGNVPVIRAQSSPQRAPQETNILPAQAAQISSSSNTTTPQPASAAKPKFDVVSIKPCAPGDDTPGPARGAAGGGASPGGMEDSPGRLRVNCMTVLHMVENAYSIFSGDPPVNNPGIGFTPGRTRGGPAWIQSERYAIEAETDDPAANGKTMGGIPADFMMMGTMFQSLLEDRFQLKVHREVEEVPMYALTVAKSGLKVKPTEESDCIPLPAPGTGMRRIGPGDKPYCNWLGRGINGPNRTLYGAASFGKLAQTLGLDRLVIDRTGITTSFNIRLEYAGDETTPCVDQRCATDPASDIPPGATVFTALEQLGLKLEPIKGPRGYIVIDSAARPSEN